MQENFEFSPDWNTAAAGAPLLPANTFASQLAIPVGPHGAPDGIILIVGSMRPPVLVGGPEGNEAVLRSMKGHLPLTHLGSFHMSRDRAQELIAILQTAISQHDEATQMVGHHA